MSNTQYLILLMQKKREVVNLDDSEGDDDRQPKKSKVSSMSLLTMHACMQPAPDECVC